MVMKDMTAITLKDLWKEVKSEDDWLGEIGQRTLDLVKRILIVIAYCASVCYTKFN